MGERPNIVFIMADDHAPRAIGAYGSQPSVRRSGAPALRRVLGQFGVVEELGFGPDEVRGGAPDRRFR